MAWLGTSLVGDAPTAFRIVPALMAGVVVVLAAREFGRGRRAQVPATVAAAGSGLVLHTGYMLGTNTRGSRPVDWPSGSSAPATCGCGAVVGLVATRRT